MHILIFLVLAPCEFCPIYAFLRCKLAIAYVVCITTKTIAKMLRTVTHHHPIE